MQNDKTQSNEFDDKDFDAVDADFSDESWDEFDDEPTGKKSTEPAVSSAPKKKTFVQKYFNFIVIGIVLIGAGLFLLGRGGGNTTLPVADEAMIDPNAPAEMAADANPPMPAPIDSAPEAVPVDPNADPNAVPDTLTPMPGSEQLAQAPAPAADLPLPVPAEPEPAPLQSDGSPDAAAVPVEPVVSDTPPAPLPVPVDIAQQAAPAELAPAPLSVPDNSAELQAANTKVTELEQTLAKTRSEMEAKVSEANQKIEALNATIKELEEKLSDVSSNAAEAAKQAAEKAAEEATREANLKAAAATTAQAPAPKKAEAKPAPVASKPAPASSKAVVWILRSAGPGWATLSSQTTGETRAVAVGEQVEGLGKINSIANENGRWTVRGSRGVVSR